MHGRSVPVSYHFYKCDIRLHKWKWQTTARFTLSNCIIWLRYEKFPRDAETNALGHSKERRHDPARYATSFGTRLLETMRVGISLWANENCSDSTSDH